MGLHCRAFRLMFVWRAFILGINREGAAASILQHRSLPFSLSLSLTPFPSLFLAVTPWRECERRSITHVMGDTVLPEFKASNYSVSSIKYNLQIMTVITICAPNVVINRPFVFSACVCAWKIMLNSETASFLHRRLFIKTCNLFITV